MRTEDGRNYFKISIEDDYTSASLVEEITDNDPDIFLQMGLFKRALLAVGYAQITIDEAFKEY